MREMSRRALLALLLCAGALAGVAPGSAAADPQLVFSTYLGGAFKYGDIGNDIAVDTAGNVYVTGRSYYSSFPVTAGAFQTHFKPVGPWDTTAFVAKFDPTGSRLIYATYLSGKGGETTGEGIAVDAAGDAYVSGYTSSDGFPTTPGTLRESGTGGFVAKLDPSGGGLLYATLIGDSSTHPGRIAVDPSGSAYVAGAGTVEKLDPTGSAIDYTHQLGPGGVAGVAADSEGHAYIAQSKGTSAALTELAADGSGVVASTLLGGPPLGAHCRCGISGVAVDSEGHAFVAGGAGSPKFQTTTGALRRRRIGRPRTSVPFVSELGPAGGAPVYSTYLSAAGDFASAVAVGPSGQVYVTGGTISGLLPVSPGAFQRKSNEAEGYAAFVTALNPSGDPVPGLVANRIERRGNRIRLHGSLDPLADGKITASAHSGRTNRRLHLRRHSGRLVATASLAGRRNWRIEIQFSGSDTWENGSACRLVHLHGRPPRSWSGLSTTPCG